MTFFAVIKHVFVIGCALDRLVSRLLSDRALIQGKRIPACVRRQPKSLQYTYTKSGTPHTGFSAGFVGSTSVPGMIASAVCAVFAGICIAVVQRSSDTEAPIRRRRT